MDPARDALERELLRAELAGAERLTEQRVYVLTASFQIEGGRRLGLHLNASNVILRMDSGGLADEEGTLRVRDRIIAVNGVPTEGTAVKNHLPGL